jgi:hypothetical protein
VRGYEKRELAAGQTLDFYPKRVHATPGDARVCCGKEHFTEGSGMHRTDTIDLIVVLEGETTVDYPGEDGVEYFVTTRPATFSYTTAYSTADAIARGRAARCLSPPWRL